MRYLLTYDLASGEIKGSQVVSFGTIPDAPMGMGVWFVAEPDEWERAVRVTPAGLELGIEPARTDPARAQPRREELLQQHGHYQVNRREAYDSLPEQIDRITKALAYLKAAGVDIGEAGIEQVEHCQAVKAKYPKRVL